MIIHVANPIYDSVFKYIMEDERIAKTILSALLKKEVVHVTVRPHEYSNTTRDTLSMFRIDFAATVREKEGNEIKDRIVLIELQKTWLNTETLRFRQYLGAQYNNKNNIREADEKGFAYPMVAVYLLGHKVGNIKEPIVYVNHDVFDYNGNVVAEGNAEPFVESLTHVRLACGASLCLAATTALTCLSLRTQWLRRLFRVQTQASRTSGRFRTVSRLSTSSVRRSSARSIYRVFAQARPCQWT